MCSRFSSSVHVPRPLLLYTMGYLTVQKIVSQPVSIGWKSTMGTPEKCAKFAQG